MTIVAHEIGAFGGMERQLASLIERLVGLGHPVTVIARRCEVAAGQSVRFHRVPGPRRPFVLGYPLFFVFASLILSRRRAGLVHATGAIIANSVDVITVHLCHRAYRAQAGIVRSRRRNWLYRLNGRMAGVLSRAGERWCYRPRRVRCVAAVSKGGAAELRRHFPGVAGRVEVIPNGVDVRRLEPAIETPERSSPDGFLTLLFVGAEWEAKRLSLAIEALRAAPDWRLLVVGDGEVSRFKRLAGRLEVADRVGFLGTVEDIARIYSRADAFVLPSAYETFSLAAHEAAACALPLVTTRVSGVEELVEDGVSGFTVSPDATEIGNRLNDLARDPELRARLGATARKRALRFDLDDTALAYSRLYARLEGTPPAWVGGGPSARNGDLSARIS